MARSVGIKRDLRLATKNSYAFYNKISLKSYLGINGDSYDRYLIRMLEMGESLNIINFVTKILLDSKQQYQFTPLLLNKIFYKEEKSTYSSMEDLINSFLF
jgi:NADH-quinone oxidoreductase subunit D